MASNFYDDEVTNESFQELKRFIAWMNKRGSYPTIIGGWAVFAYEGGIGSRDIDVVMPDTVTINELLEDDYFAKNQYHPVMRGFVPDHYKKIIQTPNGDVDIIFDIFNGENPREDTEGLGVTFHWGWTLEYQEQQSIEDLNLYVPKRELLIITKIIAGLGRTEQYRLNPDPRLISKIWKDYRDVAVLSKNTDLDKVFFQKYVKESNIEKYLTKFISGYQVDRHKSILEELDYSYDDIQKKILIK